MAPRPLSATKHCVLAGTALAVLASCMFWTIPVQAAGPLDKLGTSLNFVPEDVAFYGAMLRNGEQIEAIRKSRALAAIMALPAVQDALKRFKTEMESGQYAPQVKAAWENPEVQNALKLLADMFSHEVFVCGDDGVLDLVELMQRIYNTVQFAPLLEPIQGKMPEEPQGLMTAALVDNLELLKVPNVVIGFRLKNRPLAVEALTKLEGLVNALAMFLPQLGDKWKRATVAGNDYLTLTLDGGMIPWEEIPLDEWREQELRKGDVDKVVDRVKKLKQVVALGVRGDYLILAVGPSTDFLARLGKGRSLADRPEFRPLEKFADRRLVSLGYMSPAAASLQDSSRDARDLLKAVENALPNLELSSDQQAKIRKDIVELSADLKAYTAAVGATSSFHFLTERGIEGYAYFWGKHPNRKPQAALTLLDHIGGKPILVALGRSGSSEAQYDVAVKWVKRAYQYFEEFAVPRIPPDEREQFQKAAELFIPLLRRLDKANRLLIQAFSDGQVGLVLDARFHSRQFHRELPATEQPMPMIEPAVVLGVSDAKRVREAMAEYRAIFNEAVEALRKVVPDPDEIPPISLPEPKATQTAHGTLFTYEFPEDWGFAKEIGLHLGLSDRVAVAAFTMDHAKRLLAPTPPGVGGVLADPKRPRTAAASFDWAGLVAAATPWVELAIREIVKKEPQAGEMPKPNREPKRPAAKDDRGKPQPENEAVAKRPAPAKPQTRNATVMDQVRVALKVLAAIPSITGETYLDQAALVTHTLVEIRDPD